MKKETPHVLHWAAVCTAALIAVGCTCSQQSATTSTHATAAPTAAPPPAPAAAPASEPYGPSSATFEQGGVRYIKGSMAFPTGVKETSGLLLEKIVPAEVMVGQPFQYEYRVINLTQNPLADVRVMDRVSPNFQTSQADPKPASVQNGVATWHFDELAPGQPVTIKVTGSAAEEGTVTTCGWASYSPLLCEGVRVLRADLKLAKQAPAEVLLCDPIPMKLTVSNTGSSQLTGVKVTDTLPSGLVAENGQQTVTFDVGTLAPNQSREMAFNAKATRTGEFVNKAKVTTAQGVEAEASAKVVVRQPVLQLACSAPETRFAGRPARVELTVANKGDAASASTIIELTLPQGAEAKGVTDSGRLVGNKLVWDIGTLQPKATKKVYADLVRAEPGRIDLSATARGACADPVNTTCGTVVEGIPAILLEVIDLEDPIEVGSNETYEIKVTNQGSAPATNVRIECLLEDAQQFISGSGATAVSGSGQRITMAPVASLAPKAVATWRVVVKAAKAGDVRFTAKMTSDQLERPVQETESTNQY